MKSRKLWSLISIVLLLAMLFVACAPAPLPEENTPGTPTEECKHENTSLKNFVKETCSSAGYSGDVVCTDCGAVLTPGKATTLEHTWDEGEVTKLPTCMETGFITYTCTVCAASKIASVPTVEHDDMYHDALDGTHNHTCTTCTLSEYETHVPKDEGRAYAADCTTPAYVRYECALC